MSKRVKELITRDLANRFQDIDSVVVINPRGINAIKNNEIRRRLHEKGLRMTVVKNTLARRAVHDGGKLQGFEQLLDGPSAVIYGQTSVAAIARLVLNEKKDLATLELRGAFFDGEVYAGEAGVEQISKLPTREEALATLVAAILAPARNLAGVFKAPASKLASILKTIEDQAKEKEGAPAEA
jgi:large subunit ribosomal protein L10